MRRALVSVLTAVMVTMSALGPPAAAGAAQATTPPGADGRIAFVRANQIYTMSPTGGTVRQLTSAGRNYRPEWSPDGRRISYVHEAGGRRDVWVMGAGGGSKRAVTRTGDVTSAGATWSPDGRTLAYGAPLEAAGTSVLWLVPSTGAGAQPTVASGYDTGGECGSGPEDPDASFVVDQYLAWSPGTGSSRIAVKTSDCRFDYAVSMFHPATGEFAQAMAGGGDCCGYAEWTDLFFGPTGQLGFSERDLGPHGDEPGPRLIVYPGFASLDGDTSGAPSPSGRFMAFANNAAGASYVMRADSDGSDRRRLALGYQPDWGRKP